MPSIATVLPTDTFKTWRLRTNDLINIFNMPQIGNVLQLTTRTETFDITESAGVHIGCAVTDLNPGVDATVSVAAGEAIVRNGPSYTAQLTSIEVPATTLTLATAATNFIYVDYNAGNPIISSTTIESSINGYDIVPIAVVQVSPTFGKTILQQAGNAGDFERRIVHRLQATEGLRKAAGADLVEAGVRQIQISAGEFYYGVAEVLSAAIDTTTTGVFEYYWKNSAGNWIETISTAFDNQNYQTFGVGTGTAPMTAGWFRTDWIYLKVGNNNTTCYVVMGENEYATAAEAKQDTPPQAGHFPPALDTLGVLIGRAVIQQGAANLISLDSTLNNANFAASGAVQFADTGFRIFDDADPSRKAGFNAGTITSGVERIYELPNKNGRLALLQDINSPNDEVYKIASQGTLSTRVVPYAMTVSYGVQEDDTTIIKNGKTILENLTRDSVGTITCAAGDLLESNRPVCFKDSVDGNVLAPLNSAGEHFWFYTNRGGPHEVTVYAPYYDVTLIYKKNSTNFTISDNVWDGATGTETNVIFIEAGKTKNFFVQYDPATIPGTIPPAVDPTTEIADHFFHANGPIVMTKEGQALDHFLVMPMSREILFPSKTGTGAGFQASFTGNTITHIGSGYYVSDDLFQVESLADGAGGSGHTGIPYEMCGDSYIIEHDIAGYQILTIEPCDIRIFVCSEPFTEINAGLASRTNPLFFSNGSPSQGAPAAASLDATVGFLDLSQITGTFVEQETVTQTTSGATGIVYRVEVDRILLKSITGTFNTTNTITGGSSGATAVPTTTPYRTWRFEGSAPFALRTNDPASDEYVAVGFRRSKRDYTFDRTRHINEQLHSLIDEVQERAIFSSSFDPDLNAEWTNYNGTGTVTDIDASTIPGSMGKTVRSVTGQRWDIYNERIPFNPNVLYKITAKIRLTAAPATPGTATVYIGVTGIAADGVTYVNRTGLNTLSSQYYVAASGRDLEVDGIGTWVTVTGYFKGHGATPFDSASDPLNPTPLHDNVRFFKPTMILNNVGGTGTTEIDWFRVEEMDNDAQIAQEILNRTSADNTLQANIDTTNTNLTNHTGTPHQTLLTTANDGAASAINATGDWNSYINGGFYRGTGLLNTPTATGAHVWRYVTVIRHNASYVVQYMTDFNNIATWSRVLLNGVWQAWKRIDPAEHAALTNNPHNVTIDQISPLTTRGDMMYRSATGTTRMPVGGANQVIRSDGITPYWTNLVVQANEVAGPTAGTGYNLLDKSTLTSVTYASWNSWHNLGTWTYVGATGQVKVRLRSYQNVAMLSGYQTYGRILHNGVSIASANATASVAGWGPWSTRVIRDVNNGDTFTTSALGGAFLYATYSLDVQIQISCTAPSGYSII